VNDAILAVIDSGSLDQLIVGLNSSVCRPNILTNP
jgi:hypothetical protein